MARHTPVLSSACLKQLDFSSLTQNRMGLERETLRVNQSGEVVSTPHPRAIGHKLSHPEITVDFSEGLLELVSKPSVGYAAVRQDMQRLHAWVARNLQPGELYWGLSMPPPAREEQIEIADFGPSASGRMKQIYRQGLASRYGKIMQIISGVHFNFSFDPRFIDTMHQLFGADLQPQECRNRLYFRLIRGFDQYAWLLPYLFGASPVAARSSVDQGAAWLKPLDQDHVYGEFATSLRMSDIGYQSPAQSDLHISHANLQEYVRELVLATRTPWPDYQAMGTHRGDQWLQLNGNILQIENEYYSAIRPKQVSQRGERPACALYHSGVSYIEVRMLDVDPFHPLGLSDDTACFMEVFLLACLAWGEQDHGRAQQDKHNRTLAIRHGRQPGLELMRDTRPVTLREWADECLDECALLAQQLDAAHASQRYSQAVAVQRAKWQAPETLPSQRVLDESAGVGYHRWALDRSRRYSADFADAALPQDVDQGLREAANASFAAASKLERDTGTDVAAYVQQYFASLCDDKLAALLG